MAKCIFLILTNLLAYTGFSEEVLTMKVGEKIAIKLISYEQIKVSRKGIIELIQVEEDRWSIVALKKGSAVITSVNFDGSLSKHIVFVENHSKLKSKTERIWTEFICGTSGISCYSSEIYGLSHSWKWFYQVGERCFRHQPCIFNVTLSKEAQRKLQNYLQENYDLVTQISAHHMIQIRQGCEFIDLKTIKPRYLENFIVKHCKNQNLSVKVKVFWLKSDNLKAFGLNFRENWAGNLLTSISMKLESFLQKNLQHVLARSEALSLLGQEVLFRVGRNRLYSVSEEKSEVLKSGLQIKITALEYRNDRIKLNISMDLSQGQGNQARFDANEFKSQLWLNLNEDIIVSSSSMEISDLTENGVPILREIPIISPLFKGDSRGTSKAQIFISMKMVLLQGEH